LKFKINELETKHKNTNITDFYRGINEFKKGYHPVSKLAKGKKGDLLADLHSISNMWKNYLCQLLKVHESNGVRESETQLSLSPLQLRWLSKI
jgi:hypothetical protein